MDLSANFQSGFRVTSLRREGELWRARLQPVGAQTQSQVGVNSSTERVVMAKYVVLAGGSYSDPNSLSIDGEGLPFVRHRVPRTVSAGGSDGNGTASGTASVLVVGAGLSAADCIMSALKQGRRVVHVFRSKAEETKIYGMFGAGDGQNPMYVPAARTDPRTSHTSCPRTPHIPVMSRV